MNFVVKSISYVEDLESELNVLTKQKYDIISVTYGEGEFVIVAKKKAKKKK